MFIHRKDNRVAVVGLGNLGKAIANALHTHQSPIIVWNRTPETALSFLNDSKSNSTVEIAETLEEAVLASTILLICVSGFDAVKSIVESINENCRLEEKVLMQFTTVNVQQAQYISKWACSRKMDYLECSFLGIPTDVKNKTATILCSGDTSVYERVREVFEIFGTSEHISEKSGSIYEFDKSYYCFAYSLLIGFIQGAALAQASGYSISKYSKIVADRIPFFVDKVDSLQKEITSRNYETNKASISVWAEAFKGTLEQCHRTGVDNSLPNVLADLMQNSIDDGHGDQEISALLESLVSKPTQK
jgi:3-hydroxyisobutyrate dehydrogenase-like beta-hydroxyacid dehydrogenase